MAYRYFIRKRTRVLDFLMLFFYIFFIKICEKITIIVVFNVLNIAYNKKEVILSLDRYLIKEYNVCVLIILNVF